jgi:hypothetical protein
MGYEAQTPGDELNSQSFPAIPMRLNPSLPPALLRSIRGQQHHHKWSPIH